MQFACKISQAYPPHKRSKSFVIGRFKDVYYCHLKKIIVFYTRGGNHCIITAKTTPFRVAECVSAPDTENVTALKLLRKQPKDYDQKNMTNYICFQGRARKKKLQTSNMNQRKPFWTLKRPRTICLTVPKCCIQKSRVISKT